MRRVSSTENNYLLVMSYHSLFSAAHEGEILPSYELLRIYEDQVDKINSSRMTSGLACLDGRNIFQEWAELKNSFYQQQINTLSCLEDLSSELVLLYQRETASFHLVVNLLFLRDQREPQMYLSRALQSPEELYQLLTVLDGEWAYSGKFDYGKGPFWHEEMTLRDVCLKLFLLAAPEEEVHDLEFLDCDLPLFLNFFDS